MTLINKNLLYEIYLVFPRKCQFMFAYGSAVFPQKYQSPGKMLDIIFVVDEPVRWHRENIMLNPHHYSGLRRFGPKFVADVQEKWACGVYYNPFCVVRRQLIKYGVISTETLIRDLTKWNHLYVAGRLHKPVLDVVPPHSKTLMEAMVQNRRMALSAALLQSEAILTKFQLFHKITQLSYEGDTRMTFAENPRKAKNIVMPLMEEFDKIYMPLLKEFKTAVELPDDVIAQDLSPVARYGHMVNLPLHIQQRMVRNSNRDPRFVDMEEALLNLTFVPNLDKNVTKALADVVRGSSIYQTIQGFFTAGLIKSTKYAIEKLKKGWEKNSPKVEAQSTTDETPTKTVSFVIPASRIEKLKNAVKLDLKFNTTKPSDSDASQIVRPAFKKISLIPTQGGSKGDSSSEAAKKSDAGIQEQHSIVKAIVGGDKSSKASPKAAK